MSKNKYYVYLSRDKESDSIQFEFDNYDDLQNFIGYSIDGSHHVTFEVFTSKPEDKDA